MKIPDNPSIPINFRDCKESIYSLKTYYPIGSTKLRIGLLIGFNILKTDEHPEGILEFIMANLESPIKIGQDPSTYVEKTREVRDPLTLDLAMIDEPTLEFALASPRQAIELESLMKSYKLASEWLVDVSNEKLIISPPVPITETAVVTGYISFVDTEDVKIFVRKKESGEVISVYDNAMLSQESDTRAELRLLPPASTPIPTPPPVPKNEYTGKLTIPLPGHVTYPQSIFQMTANPMRGLTALIEKYPMLTLLTCLHESELKFFRVIGWIGDWRFKCEPNLLLMALDDTELILEHVNPLKTNIVEDKAAFWGKRDPKMIEATDSKNFINIVNQFVLYSTWKAKGEKKFLGDSKKVAVSGYELIPPVGKSDAIFSLIGTNIEKITDVCNYSMKELRHKIDTPAFVKEKSYPELPAAPYMSTPTNRPAGGIDKWEKGYEFNQTYHCYYPEGRFKELWDSEKKCHKIIYENTNVTTPKSYPHTSYNSDYDSKYSRNMPARTKKIKFKYKSDLTALAKVTL